MYLREADMAESIICFSIYLLVALIMTGIGISQLRSSTPVAFYSGEKPPEEKALSDAAAWNKKHGMMWVAYGMVILLSCVAGILTGMESVWGLVLMAGGVLVPIPVMCRLHNRLIRMYKRQG